MAYTAKPTPNPGTQASTAAPTNDQRLSQCIAALRAVHQEVCPQLGTFPYSTDSYLPPSIQAVVSEALQAGHRANVVRDLQGAAL